MWNFKVLTSQREIFKLKITGTMSMNKKQCESPTLEWKSSESDNKTNICISIGHKSKLAIKMSIIPPYWSVIAAV